MVLRMRSLSAPPTGEGWGWGSDLSYTRIGAV